MQKYPIVDKKLADWMSAFNSIPNKQTQEAQILKDLILEFQAKLQEKETISVASH